VIVVGAGFGGLAAAKGLAHAPVDVLVVDANNFHTFQPLLYQVATAGLDADDVAYAVRGTLRRQDNVDVRLGRVERIDLAGRSVHLDDGSDLPYDSLVLAAGAVTATFGVPGVEEHAIGLKNLGDALRIRAHVLHQFERAAVDPTHIDAGGLTVAIVGGGPTGVELAGGLQELFTKVLAKDFPHLAVSRARVVLIEATERLLPPFSPVSSARAARTLGRRGVEVRLGTAVARIEAGVVVTASGERIEAGTIVWAAGVRASPVVESLGVELARGGRVVVDADLRVPGHPEVFAIGDAAASPGADGRPLPQVAQVAIQGGKHAARQIEAQLRGEPATPFRYVDKGSMATIGRHDAVAELANGWKLSGPIGWMAWLGLHLVYLIGFRNKANVLVNWAWNYLTYDRGSRLIGADIEPA
jgi:NADH dehydrogenase